MKTLLIMPTYNEIENLRPLLAEIFAYAPKTHVLIIDDHSPDGTGALADEIHNENPQVKVLHRPGKLGLGTAYIAGFKYAIEHGYDAAFEMDADCSHDPRYLPDFLQAIEHADLVIGSRYIPGGDTPEWSLLRRLISGGGNIFARLTLGIPVRDCTAGYRLYRRRLLESIDLDTVQSQGFAFQHEKGNSLLAQPAQTSRCSMKPATIVAGHDICLPGFPWLMARSTGRAAASALLICRGYGHGSRPLHTIPGSALSSRCVLPRKQRFRQTWVNQHAYSTPSSSHGHKNCE